MAYPQVDIRVAPRKWVTVEVDEDFAVILRAAAKLWDKRYYVQLYADYDAIRVSDGYVRQTYKLPIT